MIFSKPSCPQCVSKNDDVSSLLAVVRRPNATVKRSKVGERISLDSPISAQYFYTKVIVCIKQSPVKLSRLVHSPAELPAYMMPSTLTLPSHLFLAPPRLDV